MNRLRACAFCGSDLADAHRLAAYCGRECRRAAEYARNREAILDRGKTRSAKNRTERVCPQCGQAFTPTRTAKQKFCSRSCGQRDVRDSKTRVCQFADCDKPVRARDLCSKHYKKSHPNAKLWKKGNPDVRRAALRKKTQLRRARERDPLAESIDRDAIGDRDEWACGICGLDVDRSLPYPEPGSASLDHIVALASGGRHTEANVQISHLYCNTVKGARPLADIA